MKSIYTKLKIPLRIGSIYTEPLGNKLVIKDILTYDHPYKVILEIISIKSPNLTEKDIGRQITFTLDNYNLKYLTY